ncbi:MAG: putative CRISPR-associated protein [Chitinivibrionales bacterium]|nr:putative CRISPR-associated protein [Chitinivibrionales bacterium]
MITTLLCTVGTSFLTNIKKEYPHLYALYGTIDASKPSSMLPLIRAITPYRADDHILGSEINSMYSIFKEKHFARENVEKLVLLHSDTQDGRIIASILSAYCTQSKFLSVDVHCETIQGLDDADIDRFRTVGLKNLVRLMAQYIRQNSSAVAINATGGYKAQIAYAAVVGQALGVPVFYMHERFSAVIKMPPQPVALDMHLWLRFCSEFHLLADSTAPISASEIDRLICQEETASLLETVEIDGEVYYDLSPAGQLFHETFVHRFSKTKKQLLPPPAEMVHDEKKCIEEPGIGVIRPSEVRSILDTLLRKEYVTRIHQIYYNKDCSTTTHFRITADCKKPDQIVFQYSNRSETARFMIWTTAKNEEQREAVIADCAGLCDA